MPILEPSPMAQPEGMVIVAHDLLHTIVALVADKRPGVLNRDFQPVPTGEASISPVWPWAKASSPSLSRMTFVVEGDEDTVEQVTKQLNKLIEVIKVSEISGNEDCHSP